MMQESKLLDSEPNKIVMSSSAFNRFADAPWLMSSPHPTRSVHGQKRGDHVQVHTDSGTVPVSDPMVQYMNMKRYGLLVNSWAVPLIHGIAPSSSVFFFFKTRIICFLLRYRRQYGSITRSGSNHRSCTCRRWNWEMPFLQSWKAFSLVSAPCSNGFLYHYLGVILKDINTSGVPLFQTVACMWLDHRWMALAAIPATWTCAWCCLTVRYRDLCIRIAAPVPLLCDHSLQQFPLLCDPSVEQFPLLHNHSPAIPSIMRPLSPVIPPVIWPLCWAIPSDMSLPKSGAKSHILV